MISKLTTLGSCIMRSVGQGNADNSKDNNRAAVVGGVALFVFSVGAYYGVGSIYRSLNPKIVAQDENSKWELPPEVKKPPYINKLPTEVEAKIFSYLKPSDLGNISAVDKRRNKVVSTSGEKTPSLKDRAIYRDVAFNSKDWKTYCKKDVETEGEKTSFPKNMWKELNKPCKVFPGARIGQTHMITWIPKMISGEPLTLNSFGGVLKQYFPDNSQGYRFTWNPILTDPVAEGVTKGEGVTKSGWVFMTVDIIPGSRDKSYTVQEGLVTNLDRGNLYKVPKAVQAVVCISTKYFKTGERLFNDNPWTYTRCQEQVQGYQVVVGGFSAAGLEVSYFRNDYGFGNVGVGAQRKFGP